MTTATLTTDQGLDMFRSHDDFFDAIRGSNPFGSDKVTAPEEVVPTVDSIHLKEFEQLQSLTLQVREQSRSIGALLWGGAGVGKSHLVSRLFQWAQAEGHAICVYLPNILSSPQHIPRHFLRSVMSELVGGCSKAKQSSLNSLLWSIITPDGHRNIQSSAARHIYQQAIDALDLRSEGVSAQFNLAVYDVLFKFFKLVNSPVISRLEWKTFEAIIDWISGDGIEVEAATEAGISPRAQHLDEDGLVRLPDDQHIAQVFQILTALCHRSGRTLLICVDQIDNIGRDRVANLAAFGLKLLDQRQGLLLVTSGIKETVLTMRKDGVMTEAQWDMLARVRIDLNLVSAEEAREILVERLRPIHFNAQTLPRIREMLERHALFPLGEKEFEERFGQSPEFRPRSVVAWADQNWGLVQQRLRDQGGEAWLNHWATTAPSRSGLSEAEVIDQAVADDLNSRIAKLRDSHSPPNADHLVTVLELLLLRLLEVEHVSQHYSLLRIRRMSEEPRPFDLKIEERVAGSDQKVRSAVTIIVARNGHSAWRPVERLATKVPADITHRILVTDDERAPLPSTPGILENYATLVGMGPAIFRHIKLTLQQYVELDALRSAIDDAANLTIEFANRSDSGATPSEVIESLHRLDRFRSHPLLRELLTEPGATPPPAPQPVPPAVKDLIATIIRGNLGWRICVSTNDVASEVMGQPGIPPLEFQQTHDLVVEVAQSMESESRLISKVHLNGLLLMSAH